MICRTCGGLGVVRRRNAHGASADMDCPACDGGGHVVDPNALEEIADALVALASVMVRIERLLCSLTTAEAETVHNLRVEVVD